MKIPLKGVGDSPTPQPNKWADLDDVTKKELMRQLQEEENQKPWKNPTRKG